METARRGWRPWVPVLIRAVVAVVAALLLGWDTAAVLYIGWLSLVLLGRDADQTARRARTTDPDRLFTDLVWLWRRGARRAPCARQRTCRLATISPTSPSRSG